MEVSLVRFRYSEPNLRRSIPEAHIWVIGLKVGYVENSRDFNGFRPSGPDLKRVAEFVPDGVFGTVQREQRDNVPPNFLRLKKI